MAKTTVPTYLSAHQSIIDAGDATAITIDSSENISIGGQTNHDGAAVLIAHGDSGVTTYSDNADELVIENAGNAGISILTPANGTGSIIFGDSNDDDIGKIEYNHSTDDITITAADDINLVTGSGNVGITGTMSVSGAITANLTGNASGTAATVTTAAQTAITSLGTLTTLNTGLTTVTTDGSGYAIKLVENSGSENYQIGVDSYGGLVFYNETTKVAEFTDSSSFNTYGNVVFNEDSADVDFRVESNGNTHALFVDGGSNHVGIGTSTLNRSGLGSDHNVLTVGADSQMGMLELQGTRTSNADLGRISFLNAGTRRAEIVAARIDADNSTKLYFQTSNAGSLGTRLTIAKDGNVGIGTTSPSALLHVKVASRATAYDADNAATWADSIVMNPSGADTSATGIAFYNNGTYHTNAASGIALVKHTASSDYGSDMAFIVRPQSAVAIEGMRLTSAGKVGIGTTSPAKLLEIKNTSDGALQRLTRSGVCSWDISIGNTPTLTGVGAGALELLPQNGNCYFAVGLAGTTTPLIHVTNTGIHTISGSASNPSYTFNDDPDTGMFVATTNTLGFATGGAERLRIDANGDVGIGGAAGTAPLSVYSDGGAACLRLIGRDNGTSDESCISFFDNSNSTETALILNVGSDLVAHAGGAERFRVKSTGYAEFNGASDLRVTFGSQGTAGTNDSNWVRGDGTGMMYNAASRDHRWEIGGSEKMRVDANGRVGIGTSSPAQPLHVYGSAYSLRIQSSTGYGQMGSGNSSYFHNDTDRGANYWGVRCEASGGFHTYSDENLKKEITTITGALDSVIKMNGVTFKWKDAEKRGGGDTGKQFGVTAQNMLTVDAELPSLNVDPLAEAGNEETDDKFYTMDYSRLTPYLIESIKELKTELDAAKARIAELESS